MAQMQFFYIGKSYDSKKISDKSFKAYKYKDEKTKIITLYPIIPSLYYSDKEIFIYGVGYKKIGKSVVEVPVFDGDSKHWNEYIEKYGIYCLFYSIDGTDYQTNDCCAYNKQREFRSILNYGIEGYVDFINHFNKMSEMQIKIIKEKYIPLISKYTCLKIDYLIEKEYMFRPCYSVYSIPFQYSPNVLYDDKCMENLYREYRESVLKTESIDYQKAIQLEKERFKVEDDLKNNINSQFTWDDYYKLRNESDELYRKSSKIITEQVNKEINTDNDIFPTSVADRVKYLYGKEVSEIYNYLVKTYLKA